MFKTITMKPRFLKIQIPEVYYSVAIKQLMDLIRGTSYTSSEINSYGIGRILINLNCFKRFGGFADKGIIYFSGKPPKSTINPNEILISITDVTRDGNVIGFPLIVPDFQNKKEIVHSMDTVYCKLKTKTLSKKFLFYLFSSEFFHKCSFSFSAGTTVLHMDLNSLKEVILPIPPLLEQQKIASILSGVDALIESTQHIIEKTERLKKGLMQRLLTKGISHTKFKKVKWLFGKEIKIPEEWEIRTLDSLISLLTNGFVGKATVHYSKPDEGVLYIQGYNVKKNRFDFHGIKYVNKKFDEEHQKSRLKFDDLLTVQTGDIGTTVIVPRELEGSNCHALIISRLKKEIADPHYYCQYFNSESCQKLFKSIEIGSTLKHLNGGDMKNLQLLCPPLQEQQKIASILSGVDAYIQKNQQYKERLEKLKKGLMQKLLTGQIRVKV